MLRKLGIFERALFLSDQHAPFNVVSVLQLAAPPEPEELRLALRQLQSRHPFLKARIRKGAFEALPEPVLHFNMKPRQGDSHWLKVVEVEMNTRLSPATSLFRCVYLYQAERAELILTFHHAIVDASSGANLLHELLETCAGSVVAGESPLAPPAEKRFPPAYSGIRGRLATTKYAAAQMSDELRYKIRSLGKRVPPVKLGARGFPLTITIPEGQVDELARRCRQEGLTLNTLLNAVQLLAVDRCLYAGKRVPLRTFTFADLRPYTDPPTPAEELGNYISMLRFTVDVRGDEDIWALAKTLHAQFVPAFKAGDKFAAMRMSEALMKMFLMMKSMRMGTAGLSFSGVAPLHPAYGSIQVTGLHGFLSGFDLGPEVSTQARLLQDRLVWDFMFLESDLNRPQAVRVTQEVEQILAQALGS